MLEILAAALIAALPDQAESEAEARLYGIIQSGALPIPEDLRVNGELPARVLLQVTFAKDGTVSECRCLEASGDPSAATFAVEFIKQKWHSIFMAGQTVKVSMTYKGLPPPTPHSLGLPDPPYPASAQAAGQEGIFKLWVEFDGEGKVKSCVFDTGIVGKELIDSTCAFVTAHWKSKRYAYQRLDIPFRFFLKGLVSPRDFPAPPPISLPKDCGTNPPRRITVLSVTFDAKGVPTDVKVKETSGISELDDAEVRWIRTHWHHTAYAESMVEMQVEVGVVKKGDAVVAVSR